MTWPSMGSQSYNVPRMCSAQPYGPDKGCHSYNDHYRWCIMNVTRTGVVHRQGIERYCQSRSITLSEGFTTFPVGQARTYLVRVLSVSWSYSPFKLRLSTRVGGSNGKESEGVL